MTHLAKLKAASSLNDLALLLGVKPSGLAYVLYKIPDENKYTRFTVPKKTGGERTISAPDPRLKMIQRRLAKLLAKCQVEVEEKLKVKPRCTLAHGFKSGFSIQTNAANHRGQRWVFNVDLHDFFPSINFGRVRGFFIKNKYYALNSRVALLIAQIACHEKKLPQGSPVSPIISNIIAHLLDIRLNELASANGCTYTRYADDLTFSTSEKSFPTSLAKRDPANLNKWTVGSGLAKRISKAGFAINSQKTRMQYRDSRQEATGLVINEKVNVRSDYYKLARSICWHLMKEGKAFKKIDGDSKPLSLKSVRGMMAFVYHVKRWDDERKQVSVAEIEKRAYFRLYADFLHYMWFFGQTRPTIVCEGKTDNVYIKCALRSLAQSYPTLVKTAGKKTSFLVQLFGFTKTATQVLKLSGGAPQLNNLLRDYRRNTANCKGMPQQPTMLIVDNDSGSQSLYSHLGRILKTDVDGSEPFYWVYGNLYVVPLPKIGSGPTAIEQLFEKEVLDTELEGRTLDLTNKETDGTKFYSKHEFSIHVVQKKQKSITFDGFRPLLDNMVAVQKDYASRVAAAAKPRTASKVLAAATASP
ncbi:retron Ec67 family RNA-directed DNA polymerase/endonuclease [Bradyrhizobium sp. SBR1B]|uniref:retron Ec67 family RNA-directed DNA polymerase/endonuclease n=1 Tax=Bradyrhizobium sp. SBR1B TaxID=2663836 RepID=UPI001605DE78|nr:retron Ec67 family RNA-directed DNA polymerase/endonuclease [Bradyrhizobium sp. SBR1B]MBB4378460.1 retron-type reverse transcriptase [Bradyrhizobium sp. SBR1B]